MTLAELEAVYGRGVAGSGALLDKVAAAVLIAAEAVRIESPGTAERRAWAKRAFEDPVAMAHRMWGALLGANAALTQAQLINAVDAGIQSAVNNAVNTFATEAVV